MSVSKKPRRTAAAVPARDEAERIAGCLEALDDQDGARLDDIVLLVNNSADDTAAIARAALINPETILHVVECKLLGSQANAGFARRQAMKTAYDLLGVNDVLLTTDADGLVDPDWLVKNLAGIDAGADVVAGWVDLHPLEWCHPDQAS
jgi:glycosyltransferase involved in cell wall biosynthesis